MSTVQGFWFYFNNLPNPSLTLVDDDDGDGVNDDEGDPRLPDRYEMALFKEGISPRFEDNKNAKGGACVFSVFDCDVEHGIVSKDWWLLLCMSLIGETLDPETIVNGLVMSRRSMGRRVSVWTSDCNEEKAREMCRRIERVIDYREEIATRAKSRDDESHHFVKFKRHFNHAPRMPFFSRDNNRAYSWERKHNNNNDQASRSSSSSTEMRFRSRSLSKKTPK